MVTYRELICLIMAVIGGFLIGAIMVTAIFVFSEKTNDE